MDHGGVGGAGAPHRAVEVVHGGGRLQAGVAHALEAAEEVSVVVLSELRAQEVEGERVDAGVDVGQAEAEDLEDIPKVVVQRVIEVKPEKVDMAWQPADDKNEDETKDDAGHLLTSRDLPLLVQTTTFALTRNLFAAADEDLSHEHVEAGNDADRKGEVDDESRQVVYLGNHRFVVFGEVEAKSFRGFLAHTPLHNAAEKDVGQGQDEGQDPDAGGDRQRGRLRLASVFAHGVDDGQVPVDAESR